MKYNPTETGGRIVGFEVQPQTIDAAHIEDTSEPVYNSNQVLKKCVKKEGQVPYVGSTGKRECVCV